MVPTDFLALVQQVEDFVRRSAAITGVHCLDLRVALQSQAKSFLENFHDNSKRKLRLVSGWSRDTYTGAPALLLDPWFRWCCLAESSKPLKCVRPLF